MADAPNAMALPKAAAATGGRKPKSKTKAPKVKAIRRCRSQHVAELFNPPRNLTARGAAAGRRMAHPELEDGLPTATSAEIQAGLEVLDHAMGERRAEHSRRLTAEFPDETAEILRYFNSSQHAAKRSIEDTKLVLRCPVRLVRAPEQAPLRARLLKLAAQIRAGVVLRSAGEALALEQAGGDGGRLLSALAGL